MEVGELDLNPKNSLERPKKCKKGPKFGQIINNLAVYPKSKLIFNISTCSKNVFEPDPNHTISPKGPKIIAPKGPKKCKKGPKCGQIENKKIWLYIQNQSWLSI